MGSSRDQVLLPLRARRPPGKGLPVAALKEMHEQLEALLRRASVDRWRREEALLQQLRDDTLSSGAMQGEFTLVYVYRRGQLLKPEIR